MDPIVIRLLRPLDHLSLELRFKGFTLSGSILTRTSEPALMMVVFEPQAVAEVSGTETQSTRTLPSPFLPLRSAMAKESRLVLELKKQFNTIDIHKAAELLNWDNFEIVVNNRARGPKIIEAERPLFKFPTKIDLGKFRPIKPINAGNLKPINVSDIKRLSKDQKIDLKKKIFDFNPREPVTNIQLQKVTPPGEWETSLELPWGMYMSPTKGAGWSHLINIAPATGIYFEFGKIFELWHTRLSLISAGIKDDTELTEDARWLRVIWADGASDVPDKPGTGSGVTIGSLTPSYRHKLVHETSNWIQQKGPGLFVPPPVVAKKLFLTGLGAYLDSVFQVDGALLPAGLDVLKWKHSSTLGRDHFIEVVQAGYILPFAHRASLVTITERKPDAATKTAVNFTRTIVVITETIKDYNYRDNNGQFLNFTFASVKAITEQSPLLDVPTVMLSKSLDPKFKIKDNFLIESNTPAQESFVFKFLGTDFDGNHISFSLPLAFVSKDLCSSPADLAKAVAGYNKIGKRTTNFFGQRFSLSLPEPEGVHSADVSFASFTTLFKAVIPAIASEPQLFLPQIESVKIIEPSTQRLTGDASQVDVILVDDLKVSAKAGGAAIENKGRIFAQLKTPKQVVFSGKTEKSGGFAAPDFKITGLSKVSGTVGGDLLDFAQGKASATSYFGSESAVLFGLFQLSDILDFGGGPDETGSYDLSTPLLDPVTKLSVRKSRIPNLYTQETPDAIITSYVLKPKLKSWSIPGLVEFSPKNTDNGFEITSTSVLNKATGIPDFSSVARLSEFSVNLITDLPSKNTSLISVQFKEVKFTVLPGKNPDISVLMQNPALVFGGPLTFINAFQTLIPDQGFYDPPYLDVSTTGVICGYTLALPNLQLGAFTLSNLSLSAEVNLPFTGSPMVLGFRFCEKHQPFTLTVSLLGGGGYFGFKANLKGLQEIDAALEFGAAAALNLGVAKGAVSIMAGIYFKIELKDSGNSTTLTGYLRINGAMSIIGLITASIELYMALTYLIDKNKAFGEASVSIKVQVLFFSKRVTVKTSRTFAGSGNDPSFKQAFKDGRFQKYWDAFAA